MKDGHNRESNIAASQARIDNFKRTIVVAPPSDNSQILDHQSLDASTVAGESVDYISSIEVGELEEDGTVEEGGISDEEWQIDGSVEEIAQDTPRRRLKILSFVLKGILFSTSDIAISEPFLKEQCPNVSNQEVEV